MPQAHIPEWLPSKQAREDGLVEAVGRRKIGLSTYRQHDRVGLDMHTAGPGLIGQVAPGFRRAYYEGMFDRKEKPLEPKEFPDQADIDSGEQDDVVGLCRCGGCGDLVYEDTPRCPHCGEWIVQAGQRWRQSGKWYVGGGLFLARTIAVNWLFLLILACIGAIVTVWRLIR